MTEPDALTLAQITGRNIAIARKLAGMNHAQLAEIVGVARTYIYAWEAGRHEPSTANFARLELALERPRWWFYKDHSLDDGPDEQAA